MKCKDLAILKIGKRPKDMDEFGFDHAKKCTDFKIRLFEKVTGLKFNKILMRWPLNVFECMEEELDYEHDVWWPSRKKEYDIFLPIANQELVDWIQSYCTTNGLTFRRVKWCNLFMFRHRNKPWVREWAIKFREEQKNKYPELVGVIYE